jgi:flavin reductase (DIM6/NTAB) family NADH-FMN oxidoreductase RutF
MALDPALYRRVMATFATGVTVITVPTPDGVWGMTANSLTSVSLDPTLLLVCVERATQTHRYLSASSVWTVNVLSTHQEQLARAFAARDDDPSRFLAEATCRFGPNGGPIIDECLAYLECRTWATYDGGDHTIFVGEVQSASTVRIDREPLLYCRGQYARLAAWSP